MNAILLGQHEPNTPKWHQLRAGGIGGSEIAAVVGLSPYVSAFWLWHFKKGNIPGPALNDAMDWGNRLEPVVTQWFRDQHPDLYVVGTPGTYAHADRDWQRCNPDALVYGEADSLLQVKTSRFGDGFGRSGSDEIPLAYRCQVMWEMDVLGADHCWLAVLIGGNEPRQYRIDYDAGDATVLREAGAAFWVSLATDDEPPIDCSDSTYEAVRALHPEIDRDADWPIPAALWHDYQQTKDKAEAWAGIHQQTKAKILAAAGTARLLTHNEQPVLRRQMSSAGTPYLKEIPA